MNYLMTFGLALAWLMWLMLDLPLMVLDVNTQQLMTKVFRKELYCKTMLVTVYLGQPYKQEFFVRDSVSSVTGRKSVDLFTL